MINKVTTAVMCLDHFPRVEDKEGNDWYVCPFCHELGMFPYGNGGIVHMDDCAIKLSTRLTSTGDFFGALAYKSILHQLASMTQYPSKRVQGTSNFILFCPFCWETEPIRHTETCIVTLAKSETNHIS